MLTAFFEALFPDLQGFIEIRAIAPNWSELKPRVLRYYVRSIDEALERVTALRSTQYNVYFGVLPRNRRCGNRSAIDRASTLWVDIDEKTNSQPLESLKKAPCYPHIVVDSGNGVHAYWLIKRIIHDIGAIESTNADLSRSCLGDKTHDAPRILRVPSTVNWKDPDNPKTCSLIHFNNTPGFPFVVGSFSQAASAAPAISLGYEFAPLDRVSFVYRRYIEKGLNADRYGFYQGDRSKLDFAVARELVRLGYRDEEICWVFTNPHFGISAKTLSKPSLTEQQRYLTLTIGKARCGT